LLQTHKSDYDAIFYDMNYMVHYPAVKRTIEIMSKLFPKAKKIVGGVMATSMPKKCLEIADIVICGFAEETTRKLIKSKFNIEGINNIVVKVDGKVISHPKNPDQIIKKIPPMKKLWESGILQLEKYYQYKNMIYGPYVAERQPLSDYFMSYGCSGCCFFCPSKLMDMNRKVFKEFNLAFSELKYLIEVHKVKHFRFLDPSFLDGNKQKLLKFAKHMKNLKCTFAFESRIDGLNKQTLSALKSAGCTSIYLGVESLNPKVYDSLKKTKEPLNLKKLLMINKFCRRHGIFLNNSFIVGLPGETIKSMKKQILFHKQNALSYPFFYLPTNCPGLPLNKMGPKQISDAEFIKELAKKANTNDPFEKELLFYHNPNFSFHELVELHKEFEATTRRELWTDIVTTLRGIKSIKSVYDLRWLYWRIRNKAIPIRRGL